MRTTIIIFLSLISFSIYAQKDSLKVEVPTRPETPLSKAEDSLKELAKTIMTNKDVDARVSASEAFMEELTAALELDGSYEFKFDSVRTILQLYPPDSTFRVMTWQLYVDKDEYKYFGIIQHQGNKKKGIPSKFTVLEDFSGRMRKIEHKVLTAQNWYGALYYNIHPFRTKEGTKYALFGFDAYHFFEKRKIMEILSFDDDMEPIFGAPVIQYIIKKKDVPPREMLYNRFMIQYSSEASASINYNTDEEMILFDHLLPMSANFPNVEYVMVPDGSYEGFKYEKGLWTYVEKVYDHKYDINEFPVPVPVFKEGKKKDILGRSK